MTQTGRPSDPDRVEVDRLAPRDEDEHYVTGEGYSSPESSPERRDEDQDWFAAMGAGRLIFVTLLASIVIVGLIVAVGGGGWIFLVVAVVAVLLATGIVTAFILKTTTRVEKPSAETVARLEHEGIRDPEASLNERVDALPEDEQDGVDPESELDSPASEQKDKVTPSSESEPVGPDDH